ncbi:tRNA m6A37 methyltransferase TrmN6 [Campylobacter pinnipediorum subsp. caledonicus]|uniref:tRNA1(Val) (adenine(37)-N6)-methyltransferase n=1 Tax=Campylobacter pinnipediorum TaxID=1965231 RepID=UPI000995146D|nr:methyltransferase [Campylobacter pinnipediorum]AQW86359.1 tRNA m6A37 methyltransferase TrmN6 [Campylobacter pinnipediorum subsp. caledonicus]
MILYQLKDGYHYNSDSLILYDFVSSFLNPNYKGSVLDVGCGCGVVGLLLKRDFDKIDLSLLDIQHINIMLCEKNLIANNLSANLIECDFLKIKTDKKFDLIVSNPPYYRDGVTKSTNTHLAISRYADELSLKAFLNTSNKILKPRAEIIFCYESLQLQVIMQILSEFKFTCCNVCFVHPKKEKKSNLVLIRAKKSSRSTCDVMTPLILQDGDKNSLRADEIYKKANTKSLMCQF